MNKLFSIFLFFISTLYAEVINQYPNQAIIDSSVKIIDIRTKEEWHEMGVLKNAIPLTFWDMQGNFDTPGFIKNLRSHIKEGEKFALICHVGTRTAMLAEYLDKEYKMNVINLLGGMEHAKKEGLQIIPYKAK